MLVQVQEDDNGVDHPVCYFSKKFNKHQKNYSTVEKECLSLILALQHFDGWMDGYFVYRRSTLKGHIASNKFYVI